MPDKKILTEQDVIRICQGEILKHLGAQKTQPVAPVEYIWRTKEFLNPNADAREMEINDWLKKTRPVDVKRSEVDNPFATVGTKTIMNIQMEKPEDDGKTA